MPTVLKMTDISAFFTHSILLRYRYQVKALVFNNEKEDKNINDQMSFGKPGHGLPSNPHQTQSRVHQCKS